MSYIKLFGGRKFITSVIAVGGYIGMRMSGLEVGEDAYTGFIDALIIIIPTVIYVLTEGAIDAKSASPFMEEWCGEDEEEDDEEGEKEGEKEA